MSYWLSRNSTGRTRRQTILTGGAVLSACVAGCLGGGRFDAEEAASAYYRAVADMDWESFDDVVHSDTDLRDWFGQLRGSDSDPKLMIGSPQAMVQDYVRFDTISLRSVEIEDVTEFEGVREVSTAVVWRSNDGRETAMRETLEFRRADGEWLLWEADPRALLKVHEELGPCPTSTHEDPTTYVSRQVNQAADDTYGHINSIVSVEFVDEDGNVLLTPDNLQEVGIRFPFELRTGNYYEFINEVDDVISTVTRNRDEIRAARNAVESCDVPEKDLVEEAIDGAEASVVV
jgi:hypothetical protein